MAACAALLAGCNAVEDVHEKPYTPIPAQTAVLQGQITGLASRRPVVLQYNGEDVCVDAAAPTGPRIPCRFFGVLGQDTSAFSFGSLPVGTPYNITVKTQPFGKVCTVNNGQGTLSTLDTNISVSCVNDPAVPRYAVRGTIAPAASSIAGLKVILSTEEGTQEINATGLSTFEFPNAVFNNQYNAAPGVLNLPVFAYTVTATVPPAVEGNPVDNCAVTNGTNIGADGAATAAPTAAVTNIAITSCKFTVRVGVNYNAATGGPTLAMGAGGVSVALRNPATGLNIQPPINIAAFTTASTLVPFPEQVASNASAMYELIITSQPAQQTCIAGFGSGVTGSAATDAGAVLLLKPAAAPVAGSWLVDRAILCRAVPLPANQLEGAYQLTTTTTIVETKGSAAPVTTVTTAKRRNFLALFRDGTFLYGIHNTGVGCNTACGVQHGFYDYNPTARTLTFAVRTDTVSSTTAPNKIGSAALTQVSKNTGSPSVITARFSGPTTTTATTDGVTTTTITTVDWSLGEPLSIPSQMTGAWVTADHRRMWIYEGSKYTGFHAGVNGMGNAQDACFPIDPPASLTGYFTRRGNATTCQLGEGAASATQLYTMEVPSATTAPAAPLGLIGGWPQARSNADGRPSSPVLFTIVPGNPDRLTVQDTAHDGTPVNPPIELTRLSPN